MRDIDDIVIIWWGVEVDVAPQVFSVEAENVRDACYQQHSLVEVCAGCIRIASSSVHAEYTGPLAGLFKPTFQDEGCGFIALAVRGMQQ